MSVQLGDKAKDQVTGFTGICVALTQWLNGCTRVTLQSDALDKDGKPQEGQTFDEPQLQVVKPRVVTCGPRTTGGPKPTPTQAPGPRR